MKGIMQKHWKTIWYMFCFLALGVIDQRRGSAVGEVQMIAANCTGLVMAAMVMPGIKPDRLKCKVYVIWTPICILLSALAIGFYSVFSLYQGPWSICVISIAVWSYLLIYMIKERTLVEVEKRLHQPFFWCLAIVCVLSQLSVHEGFRPLWYLLIYGGFYMVGIPEQNRQAFFSGMLNGLILWFFVQQITAFGLRPYDYVRYRGMYSGETQNGIFYMLVYCAFLVKWIWARERSSKKILRYLYFFLAAGCVSFLMLTGGRAPLVGVAAVTIIALTWYDIIHSKRVHQWLIHGVVLGLCVMLTFPIVYGCIRYLPTILHHPIWFEGEYNDECSVRSFDPWNSERYISFEEAAETNVGRILQLFSVKVHAAEKSDPGSSPDNPYMLPGMDEENSISIRKTIYSYYLSHLNWRGHTKEQATVYLTRELFFEHTHNMFLQMAYDYGILTGVLFLGICIYSLLQIFWKKNPYTFVWTIFLIAVFTYGLAEMAVVPGQITIVLVYLIFYFVGDGSKQFPFPKRTF